MLDRVAIFIDGAYVDNITKTYFKMVRIDYEKLVNWIQQQTAIPLFRTYYYYCPPFKSNPPTDDENDRTSKQQRFIDRLERIPFFQTCPGKLVKKTNSEGVSVFVQKGVDVHLAVDLVKLSLNHSISHAVILAGDGDFVPAVQVAKESGVLVTLIYGGTNTVSPVLFQTVDDHVALTQDIVDTALKI